MAGTTSSSLSAVGTRSVVAARVGGPRWLGSGAVANSLWSELSCTSGPSTFRYIILLIVL